MEFVSGLKRCVLCGDVRVTLRLKQAENSVFQCSHCGLVSIDPLPTEKDLCSLYLEYDIEQNDRDFPSHLAWRKRCRLPVFREILDEVIGYKRSGMLLDIGCSFGLFLAMAKERRFDPHGVDLSLNAVRYATQTLRLPVRHGTVFDAGFSEGSFDVITILGVLEHIPNPMETLGEVFRVLRRGGIVVVEVPNANFNLLRGRISPSLFYIGTHLFNFTPGALTLLLETSGFRCSKMWCGKADRPKGWLFNSVKSSYVLAASLLQKTLGCYWGPSLVALAVKS